MKRIITIIAAGIFLALSFDSAKADSRQKYDYNISLIIDTRVGTGPARNADVTIKSLDVDMDLNQQTQPLDENGAAYFSNIYTDIQNQLRTIQYDFKINEGNISVNIPNIVSAKIYNEKGQTLYSKKIADGSAAEVPVRLSNVSDLKLFYSFTDASGETYSLRRISSGSSFGFGRSGAWGKTFHASDDAPKSPGSKSEDYIRFEVKIVPNDLSNMEKTEIDTMYVSLKDDTIIHEMFNLERIRQEKRMEGTIRNLEDLVGIEGAKVVVAKLQEDGSFKHLDSTFTNALGEYSTNRIAVNDSMYFRIKKDGFVNTVVRDWENMIDYDQGYFISRLRVSEILCKWHFPSFDITCHPLRKHNV